MTYVRFRNVSGSTCLLTGYPRVVATQAGLPDVTATDGTFFLKGHSANMAPGAITVLGMETDTYCAQRPDGGGASTIYHRVSIAIPGGGIVSLATPHPVELDLTCGLHLTRFADPNYPQPTPVYPLSVLRATLELPPTAKAGSVLRFIVDLENPTAHRVSLEPCPGYLESAVTSPTPVKQVFALNCVLVPTLSPHQTVRFAMRLRLPPDSAAGPTRVFWDLPVPGTPTTGFVDITD